LLAVEEGHKNDILSLNSKMDSLKASNSKLRQENEGLQSSMKKMSGKVRDAERETQRALHKFEGAVKSLEQLEYQYSLLEKDSKETEEIKSRRILSLEDEIEDLRAVKLQETEELMREKQELSDHLQQMGHKMRELEQKYRRSEVSAAESFRSERSLKSKVEQLESMVEKYQMEALKWKEEAAQATGEVQRLQGAVDGATNVSKSTATMLKSYENGNEMMRREISELRDKLQQADSLLDEEKRRSSTAADESKSLSLQVKKVTEEIQLERKNLSSKIESLNSELETKAKLWKSEKDSLLRELEVLHAKVEGLTLSSMQKSSSKEAISLSIHRDDDIQSPVSSVNNIQPEVGSQTPVFDVVSQTNDDATPDEVSLPKPVAEEDESFSFQLNQGSTSSSPEVVSNSNEGEIKCDPLPHDTVIESPTKDDRLDLRRQLTALKLSLLDHTPSKSSSQMLTNPENEYVKAHRPDSRLGDKQTNLAEETSSDELTDSEADAHDDPLSKAKYQVSMAKEYLRRMSSIDA
jgi:chromosome segregation ATPase